MNTTPPVDDKPMEEELSDVEKDAINSVSDVKGELTDNEEALIVEEPDNSKDDTDTKPGDNADDDNPNKDENLEPDDAEPTEEPDDTKPTIELKTEIDEEGVYEAISEDPGNFKPGDYSFEIKTADGKTHKLSTPEDVDAFAATLDDNPESITASQFALFNRKAVVMEQGIASDKKVYETDKGEFDKQTALTETRETQLKQWNNEINYLSTEGKLPEISVANNKADWSDPEVAKDPAVAARLDLLEWMSTENEKRMLAGLEPMTSMVDAFNNRRLEQIDSQDEEDKKSDTADRRRRGGKVGGNAPYSPEAAPKNSIVGKGGSLGDLVTEFMAENQ